MTFSELNKKVDIALIRRLSTFRKFTSPMFKKGHTLKSGTKLQSETKLQSGGTPFAHFQPKNDEMGIMGIW